MVFAIDLRIQNLLADSCAIYGLSLPIFLPLASGTSGRLNVLCRCHLSRK